MKKLTKLLIVFLFTSIIFSCSSNVNIDNFNMIDMGMSKYEVESILGDGDALLETAYEDYSMEVLSWKDGSKVITISFSNDEVAAKVKVGF